MKAKHLFRESEEVSFQVDMPEGEGGVVQDDFEFDLSRLGPVGESSGSLEAPGAWVWPGSVLKVF